MKKFLATILAVLYLATTTGATIHMHYCMDKLVELNLWHSEKDQCSNCGMETSQQTDNGCCKDEHKQVKIENDHQKSSVAQYVQAVASPALVTPVVTYIFKATSLPYFTPLSNAPPHIPKRLHVLNCVFLI